MNTQSMICICAGLAALCFIAYLAVENCDKVKLEGGCNFAGVQLHGCLECD